MKNFWAKVKSLFKYVLGHAPSAITDAQLALAGLAPLVEAADPAIAPAVAAGVKVAVAGLEELQVLIEQYEKAPGAGTLANLQAGVNTATSNLSGILAAAQVKNPATAAKITSIVTAISATINTFESSVLAVHPANG
jgi:hypothetical protein